MSLRDEYEKIVLQTEMIKKITREMIEDLIMIENEMSVREAERIIRDAKTNS